MDIETTIAFIGDFLKANELFYGPCKFTVTERLDAAIFPDELGKMPKENCGLYIISTKGDSVVRYVGISTDIESRIYTHIGSHKTWRRNGHVAHFPNCKLAAGRHWQNEEEIKLLRNAMWEITVVITDPPHMAGLLEVAIIHFGMCNRDGPTINVAFDVIVSPTSAVFSQPTALLQS